MVCHHQEGQFVAASIQLHQRARLPVGHHGAVRACFQHGILQRRQRRLERFAAGGILAGDGAQALEMRRGEMRRIDGHAFALFRDEVDGEQRAVAVGYFQLVAGVGAVGQFFQEQMVFAAALATAAVKQAGQIGQGLADCDIEGGNRLARRGKVVGPFETHEAGQHVFGKWLERKFRVQAKTLARLLAQQRCAAVKPFAQRHQHIVDQ